MKLTPHDEKNLIYLGIVVVSFIVLVLFFQNQNFLVEGDQAITFFWRAAALGVLSIVLLYVVSNRKSTSKAKKSRKK